MGHVTGQALPVYGRFMVDGLRLTLLCVAVNAQGIPRFTQQVRLSGGRYVWPVTCQTVAFSGRAVDRARMPGDTLRSEQLETVTVETELLPWLPVQTGVIAGMRAVTSDAAPVSDRRMCRRIFERRLEFSMTLVTQL